MGNRALIKGKGSNLGVYVHWNGGYDSVLAFTQYCKLKGYRSPETDDYGVARLCQVIGNYFGGSCSVGVWNMTNETTMNPSLVDDYCLDNGVYEIENWEIVAHWNSELVTIECHEGYDLTEFLCDIDEAMPKKEQLGEEFLTAEVVKTSELKVGDKVYIQDNLDGKVEVHTVMGIAGDDEWHNGNVSNLPYVDLYDHNGDWSWNTNNYIKTEFVRKFN